MRAWAEGAAAFVRAVAQERAGGLAATVRTIAHCGNAGLVAYSLLGEEACPPLILPTGAIVLLLELIARWHRAIYLMVYHLLWPPRCSDA